MKILQINCVYKNGSTGKIVADIHFELLKNGIESIVCYGRGNRTNEPYVYKTCGEYYSKLNNLWSRITGIMYGGCGLSTHRLISIIKKEKPDIVHIHCINGYFVNIFRLIQFLKKNKIKTVLTLHAEFMYTANCGYALDCDKWREGCRKCSRFRQETKSFFLDRTQTSWKRMKNAFNDFDNLIVTSVSPWLMERAKRSAILADKQHCVVFNGLDTSVFYPRDARDLVKKHNLEGHKVIFHATPYFSDSPDHFKGGYYVLELAKRLRNQKHIKIIVAGAHSKELTVPDNMILLGRVSDQNLLAQYYSLGDVTVLTSKKETFSMICAESLCCGTPIVGFKACGPEQIALPQYSFFVEQGDICALEDNIMNIINLDETPNFFAEAKKRYNKESMTHHYCNIYKKLFEDV